MQLIQVTQNTAAKVILNRPKQSSATVAYDYRSSSRFELEDVS